MPVEKTCVVCGKAYRINSHRQDTSKYCSRVCMGLDRRGTKSRDYTGRYKRRGYIYVEAKDHPYADKRGSVPEHRLVMEKSMGRLLDRNEVVHHINGNKSDNRIENLEVMTQSEHTAMHNTVRLQGNTYARISGWSKNYTCCKDCGGTDVKHSAKGLCRTCYTRERREKLKLSLPES